jgi:Ribulose-phosphate 3 epimerase family
MPGFVAPAAIGNSAFFAAHLAKSAASCRAVTTTPTMLYGKPRPVQIIPSVLPADWANMGYEVKRLEDAGVDRIQFDVMDGAVSPLLDTPLA